MRFIWDKATTDDNWSYSEGIERPWGINIPRGDIDFTIRDDRPHPLVGSVQLSTDAELPAL